MIWFELGYFWKTRMLEAKDFIESKEQMGNEFHYKAVSLWRRHF